MLKTKLFTTLIVCSLPATAFAAASFKIPPMPARSQIVLVAEEMDDFKPVKAGDIEITAAAIKAMTPGQPVGGGYLTIANHGSSDDRLVSVEISKGADRVELHEMAMNNDVMTMRMLADGIPLPAGQTVEMKPGGLHMMIMGVKTPFKAGEMVSVTLKFEKAGDLSLDIPVRDMKPGMNHKM